MEQYTVQKEIHIAATPEKVWDALTNPEKTKKFFFNCEVHSTWQPGSPITFKGKMLFFINIEMHGTIVEAIPNKLLKYTLENKSDDGTTTSTVTDELTYNNGITTLTISDNVGDGEGAEKRYERSVEGWDKILSGLKELVEDEDK